jgi:hypothetical protein
MHGFLILSICKPISPARGIQADSQNTPLQRAFLNGMEPLLGVQPLRNPQTQVIEPGLERAEAASRGSHASTGIERVEEERWDAGIGAGGAFADRVATERAEGLERTVWEFRTEESQVEEEGVESGHVEEGLKELAAAPSTPEHDKVTAAVNAHPEEKKKVEKVKVRSAKVAYRFVDTSSTT